MLVQDFHKVFCPVDFVKVMSGCDRGREGWVVNFSQDIVTVMEHGTYMEVDNLSSLK
jgi:transcription elongation factor